MEVRERILEAALGLLSQSGAHELTQPRVAKAAGVRQSHLTYYFPTRADLLQEVARYSIGKLAGDLAHAKVHNPRQTAQGIVQGGGRLLSDRLEIDQGIEIRRRPIAGRLRIIDLDDVASERKDDDVVPTGREREVAGDVCPNLLSHPF